MFKIALLGLLLAVFGNTWAKEVRISTFEHDTPQLDSGIKVMAEIYQRIGHKMTIVRFPGKRSLVEANIGNTEGELLRIKAVEKKYPNLVRVPYAIGSLTAMALVRAGQPKVAGLSGLLDKRVGILRGVEYTEILTRNLNREIVNSIDSLFSILLSERVDVIVFPALDARIYIKQHALESEIDIGDYPLAKIPLYHFLHKNSQAIATQLNKEMQSMKRSGELDQLIMRAAQSQQE